MADKASDFTSFWHFKDELAKAGLTDRLFEEINRQLNSMSYIMAS